MVSFALRYLYTGDVDSCPLAKHGVCPSEGDGRMVINPLRIVEWMFPYSFPSTELAQHGTHGDILKVCLRYFPEGLYQVQLASSWQNTTA